MLHSAKGRENWNDTMAVTVMTVLKYHKRHRPSNPVGPFPELSAQIVQA